MLDLILSMRKGVGFPLICNNQPLLHPRVAQSLQRSNQSTTHRGSTMCWDDQKWPANL